MTTALMADSVTPNLIPVSYRALGTRGVGLYSDGLYAASAQTMAFFPRRVMIAVEPHSAGQASAARVLDVERFDATPEDWPPFAVEREQLGHDDATCYCSLSVVADVVNACHAAAAPLPRRWWIAWYIWRPPSVGELLSSLRGFGVDNVDPMSVWACQYAPLGAYDVSVVYGDPDWTTGP